MVYTERAETAAVLRGTMQPCNKQTALKYTTWVGIQNERTNERFIELGRLPMSNREVGVGGHFLCINNLSIKTSQQRLSPYTHTHTHTHTHTRARARTHARTHAHAQTPYLRTHSRKLEHTHTRAHPYSRARTKKITHTHTHTHTHTRVPLEALGIQNAQ